MGLNQGAGGVLTVVLSRHELESLSSSIIQHTESATSAVLSFAYLLSQASEPAHVSDPVDRHGSAE